MNTLARFCSAYSGLLNKLGEKGAAAFLRTDLGFLQIMLRAAAARGLLR